MGEHRHIPSAVYTQETLQRYRVYTCSQCTVHTCIHTSTCSQGERSEGGRKRRLIAIQHSCHRGAEETQEPETVGLYRGARLLPGNISRLPRLPSVYGAARVNFLHHRNNTASQDTLPHNNTCTCNMFIYQVYIILYRIHTYTHTVQPRLFEHRLSRHLIIRNNNTQRCT